MLVRYAVSAVFAALTLAGCSGIPSVPYVQPSSEQGTARIRVITNSSVFGDNVVGTCAPSPRHKMAEAGRFGDDGRVNVNYPQFPVTPVDLGVPNSVAPELVQYVGAVRMAEGLYTKVETQYRVSTAAPFQLATLGAAVGSYGSTYSTCPAIARVYTLQPGKDYQAIVGVGRMPFGDSALTCFFGLFELTSIPGGRIALPKAVAGTEPPTALCK